MSTGEKITIIEIISESFLMTVSAPMAELNTNEQRKNNQLMKGEGRGKGLQKIFRETKSCFSYTDYFSEFLCSDVLLSTSQTM